MQCSDIKTKSWLISVSIALLWTGNVPMQQLLWAPERRKNIHLGTRRDVPLWSLIIKCVGAFVYVHAYECAGIELYVKYVCVGGFRTFPLRSACIFNSVTFSVLNLIIHFIFLLSKSIDFSILRCVLHPVSSVRASAVFTYLNVSVCCMCLRAKLIHFHFVPLLISP